MTAAKFFRPTDSHKMKKQAQSLLQVPKPRGRYVHNVTAIESRFIGTGGLARPERRQRVQQGFHAGSFRPHENLVVSGWHFSVLLILRKNSLR